MAFTFQTLTRKLKVVVQQDGRLVKTYTTSYLCHNESEMTEDEVAAEIGILPGAPHAVWTFATCRDIEIDRKLTREPECAWIANYTHSTDAPVPNDAEDTDPTLRRVTRSTGTNQQSKAIIRDKNGLLLTNAAKTPFDGGVPVEEEIGTIEWNRDEEHDANSLSKAVTLSGLLNSTTFMGCAAGTLKLRVKNQEKWEGSYHFWATNYVMTYNRDGWDPAPANAGLWQLVAGVPIRIMIDGVDCQSPEPLTAGGALVPVADRPGSCNFIDVEWYDRIDFSTLGLPTT